MPLAIVVLILASAFRVFVLYVPELSNFSPVMALAFCAGAYTRNRSMWIAPFAALVASDLYINHYYATTFHYDWSVAGTTLRILCFAGALYIGVAISNRRNWLNLLGGTLAGSFLYYLVTNTASWHGDLGYTQNFAGWWQAMTIGHPQYLPTLFFFRNSLMSDLLFTGCFALMMEYSLLRKGEPSLLGLKQVSR